MADRHFLPGLILAGFMLAVAGCQSGDSGGAVLGAENKDAPPPAKEKVLESELRGYCPTVTLRDGTAYFNSYAKGGQDDPAKLVYQSSIAQVSRSCTRSNGMLNITVAVAGRVVPGPAVKPGSVTMPIRIAVIQGDTVIYSELHKYQANIADTSTASQFVFNDPNISLPDPTVRNIRIYAGFDEGPPKKTASAQ
ncbi:hypothetical protein RB623_18015 [Mesorhizobium sp. LHD-90]|uniref:hypothetical protein n=1 Tax=Mesorhizobium sp. LHD-90 TaxID=3071414 RepID=UPI0027E213F7|nr:hypothetical protein [Mesorhizobium sp. LHD-90]MDQ6435955.1 hypothetical protein [Mesorhizobium sp. LHD-90]